MRGGDDERAGDLLVGTPVDQEPEHLQFDSSPPPRSEESVSPKCAAGIDGLHASYPLGRVTIDREQLIIEVAGLSRVVLPRQEVLRIRRRRMTGYWVLTPGRRRLRFNTVLGHNRAELQRAAEWGWPLELP